MEEKRFNLVDIFGLMSFAILSDTIGIILVFFGLDDFWILDSLNLFPIGYLILVKSLSFSEAGLFLTGTGLELIPWVGDLPMLTIAMAINIWIYNHPESKFAKIAQKAKQVVPTKGAPAKGVTARSARPGAPGIKTPVGGLQPAQGKIIQADFGQTKPALTKTQFKEAA